jgi:hypothetical protein
VDVRIQICWEFMSFLVPCLENGEVLIRFKDPESWNFGMRSIAGSQLTTRVSKTKPFNDRVLVQGGGFIDTAVSPLAL